jgi:hypothetical protein
MPLHVIDFVYTLRSEEEFVVIQFGDRERLVSEPNITAKTRNNGIR